MSAEHVIPGTTYAALREIALHGPRERQIEPLHGTVHEVQGLRNEAGFSGHRFVIDEPLDFGGTGSAANPAEFVLAGLGASLQVTCRVYAMLMGIEIEHISVELNGNLDTRGFFDTDPAVRAGFDAISAKISIRTAAEPSRVRELLKKVERGCPVLDLIRAPTPVDLQLEILAS